MDEIAPTKRILGSDVDVLQGFAFGSDGFSKDDGLPLVRIRDLKAGLTETRYSGPYSDQYLIEPGDVLIGMDGDFKVVRWSGEKALLNQRVCRIRSSSFSIDDGFLFHAITPEIDRVHRLTPQTTVRHLSTDGIRSCSVLDVSLEEQRRIAEILDTIDEAISTTERVILKLKAICQACDAENMSNSEDSKTIRLGDVCKVLGGKRLPIGHSYAPYDTQYRYLKVEDFYRKSVNYSELESLDLSTFELLKRYEIRRRELFISIAGSIGHVGICHPPVGLKTILTENAAKIVCSKSFIPEYLALQMNSSAVTSQINSEIGTGGGVPKLALHRIANLRVNCPTLYDQEEVVRRHEAGHSAWTTQEKKLMKLKRLRAGLADDLLSGRVRTVAE